MGRTDPTRAGCCMSKDEDAARRKALAAELAALMHKTPPKFQAMSYLDAAEFKAAIRKAQKAVNSPALATVSSALFALRQFYE